MKGLGTHGAYELVITSSAKDRRFFCQMGPFFASREVVRDLEGAFYDSPAHLWVLARLNGAVVGFAALRDAGGCVWWMDVAWVAPEHRRKGIHRALYRARQEAARERGARVLKAAVREHARALFDADGWTVTSTRGPRWTWYEKHMGDV